MVNRDLVARKLARAQAWMTDAAARLDRPRDLFLADADARDLATFHLFLAIQEVIDLAAHWVADAGWEPPDDAGGAFDVLAKRGVISVPAATELRAMVGLRNRIAHGYATLDHERLHEEANAGLAAMRAFLVVIADAAGL
jgi:uncharacterized protein YutE (UPF0331/DUF86 family)